MSICEKESTLGKHYRVKVLINSRLVSSVGRRLSPWPIHCCRCSRLRCPLARLSGLQPRFNRLRCPLDIYSGLQCRCNRLRCPLARLSGFQWFNMDHNGPGINMYGVVMILMGNLHSGGKYSVVHLSLLHRYHTRAPHFNGTRLFRYMNCKFVGFFVIYMFQDYRNTKQNHPLPRPITDHYPVGPKCVFISVGKLFLMP